MESPKPVKRSYRGKFRRITACSECYRRKQKCDRQQPCSGCVVRKIPGRCSYDHEASPQQNRELLATGTDVTLVVDESQPSTVSSNIGYVGTSEYDVLKEINISTPSSHNTSPFTQPVNNVKILALLDILPDIPTIQRLVDIYFSEANWYFSMLDRCFFNQRYRVFLGWLQSSPRGLLSREVCHFVALLLQVFAIALQFLPQTDKEKLSKSGFTKPSPEVQSKNCSEAGESILTVLQRYIPSLSSTEADLVRCAWLKNSGNGLQAWHSLGNAVRQAQDLKFHVEPIISITSCTSESSLREQWNNEHKRRVWACLFTWDAHMAIQLGRPRLINIVDCTVRRPTNCDAPVDVTKTLLRANDSANNIPSQYTSHIVKYEIALKIHKAMNVGILKPETPHYKEVQPICHEIEQLLLDISPVFRKENPDRSWDILYPDVPKLRLQIQVIVESFLLALHRPHMFEHTESLHAALEAARNVLILSEDLFKTVKENQYKTFTVVFHTIDAAMFIAIALSKLDSESYIQNTSRETFITVLENSIHRLGFLQRYHTVATTGKAILESCLKQVRSNTINEQSAQTLQSPVTVSDLENNLPGLDMFQPNHPDSDDTFWTNLLNDPGATSSWLDNFSNSWLDGFDLASIDLASRDGHDWQD